MDAVVNGGIRHEEASATQPEAYEQWFTQAIEKGLKDIAEGRVFSADESRQRDAARRARLAKLSRRHE